MPSPRFRWSGPDPRGRLAPAADPDDARQPLSTRGRRPLCPDHPRARL